MNATRALLLAAAGVMALSANPAAAQETLREALVRTYETNPTIMAQRDALRATDENVAVARAGLRPQVSATVGVNQDLLSTNAGEGRNFSVGVDVSYPLFNGGRVRNQIAAAELRSEAGRFDLRGTEGDIFTEAVSVYMDVIRDRSIVALNENQVRVLQTNLEATRDRFEVGDLTRTDVAQSEARLALAQSTLATAQGRLRASEEAYRRVIGVLPGELDPPPTLPRLPGTPDEAVDIALANNPDLSAIAQRVRAAGLDIEVERSQRLPTVNAVTGADYFNRLGSVEDTFGPGSNVPNDTASIGVGVTARVPIYQGGLVGARVRQTQAFRAQLVEQAIEVERLIVARTRAAFATYRAALEAIDSNEVAVAANRLALEGTRAEQTVGTRNVLDVLNAEQELLNSEVQLITARRDAYVAGFALLNAMGMAEAEDLGLDGGTLYDPLVSYRRTVRRASDWNDDPDPRPDATRTVDPGAVSPINPVVEVMGPPDPRRPAPQPANSPVTEPRQ
jgi:outer membrane protein